MSTQTQIPSDSSKEHFRLTAAVGAGVGIMLLAFFAIAWMRHRGLSGNMVLTGRPPKPGTLALTIRMPGIPQSEVHKATLAELRLGSYRNEFVLGEPVVLTYTPVSPAEERARVYETYPYLLPVCLVVERDGVRREFRSLGVENDRLFSASQQPKRGFSFDRVDMWGYTDRNLDAQVLFDRPGKYRIWARVPKGRNGSPTDSKPVDLTIVPPSYTDSKALELLKEGTALWAAFVRRGPADPDRGLLTSVAKEYPSTAYEPYILFALAQDIDEGNMLGSNEPVPNDMYERFLVSYWAAERLIEKYPKFCLRDDAFYRLLKSWGFMPMVRMWRINAKDPKQAVPHVRSFVERSERFLKDYPRSPYVQEVQKLLGPARDYVRKHGG